MYKPTYLMVMNVKQEFLVVGGVVASPFATGAGVAHALFDTSDMASWYLSTTPGFERHPFYFSINPRSAFAHISNDALNHRPTDTFPTPHVPSPQSPGPRPHIPI